LNWLGSYLTKSKTVLKPSNKPSDKQPTIYFKISIGCFSLCLEKQFSPLKQIEQAYARDYERSYKDSKHPRLNPNKRRTTSTFIMDLKHQSSHILQPYLVLTQVD